MVDSNCYPCLKGVLGSLDGRSKVMRYYISRAKLSEGKKTSCMSKNINMHVGDITTLIVSEVVGKGGFLLVFILSTKNTSYFPF